MADPMKIRASSNGSVTEVKVLMSHPMETGLRKDPSGNLIPAHYITQVTAEHGGKQILKADWSQSISQNPFLAFKFKGGSKGESVKVSWVDSKGDKRTDEAKIS